MADPLDFPARGKVLRTTDAGVIFAPSGTTYQLHLNTTAPYAGPLDKPVRAILRARARKVYTIPTGGNFITPIVGPPRIVQGWVLYVDDRQLVVDGGAKFLIELPFEDSAIDLDEGALVVNNRVNVTLFPGATFELAPQPAAAK